MLILIRGLPRSGKTTLAKQILEALHLNGEKAYHYETKQFFRDSITGKSYIIPILSRRAHEDCYQKVCSKLAANNDNTVIVSNPFITRKEVQPYIDIAHHLEHSIKLITCEMLDTSRIKLDPVTKTLVDRMAAKWEKEIPLVPETHIKKQLALI